MSIKCNLFSDMTLDVFLSSAIIGELDEEEDGKRDLASIRAAPLKAIAHG